MTFIWKIYCKGCEKLFFCLFFHTDSCGYCIRAKLKFLALHGLNCFKIFSKKRQVFLWMKLKVDWPIVLESLYIHSEPSCYLYTMLSAICVLKINIMLHHFFWLWDRGFWLWLLWDRGSGCETGILVVSAVRQGFWLWDRDSGCVYCETGVLVVRLGFWLWLLWDRGSGCETGVLVETEGSSCQTGILAVRWEFWSQDSGSGFETGELSDCETEFWLGDRNMWDTWVGCLVIRNSLVNKTWWV